MKNIYLLPTDKPSRLNYSKVKTNREIEYKLELKQEYSKCNNGLLSGPRNIYITSDEEIKSNCWSLNIVNNSIYKTYKGVNFQEDTEKEKWRKIILTTDQDLIKDGVQEISDDFLEWFVKNPSCEFVYLGYTSIIRDSERKRTYKIIIPKEESKQIECYDKFNQILKEGGEGCIGAAKWNNVPVTAFTKEGILFKSFESQKQCANYFRTTPENVKAVVNGRNILLLKKYQIKLGILKENINPAPKYKSYEWSNKPDNHWLSKKIKCIEDDLVFNSQTEAAKHYNISITTINNIINGRSKKTRNGKSFCSL